MIPRYTVLIFDSGVGGLSIYKSVWQLLPHLHYIYAFDNAGFPYGEKAKEFIIDRVLKITSAVQKRHAIVMIIIACNTASTISLPALRKRFRIPIVGVVPAIKPAAHLTVNRVVGLLATRGTIQSSYTHKLIAEFASECKIGLLGSSELVELAEAKFSGKVIALTTLKKILLPLLEMSKPPDTIVLGCTHFSILLEELTLLLPPGTCLVDSSNAIARRIAWLISMQENAESSQEDNLAYCMVLNKNTEDLLPILDQYGFQRLERLPL